MSGARLELVVALAGALALYWWSRTPRGQVATVDALELVSTTARRIAEPLTALDGGPLDVDLEAGPLALTAPSVGGFFDQVIDTVKSIFVPRGIRNRNPGNLRPGAPWVGAIGTDGGYLIFDTMANGVRAMARNLLTYQRRYGLETVRGIIERWAPPVGRDPATGKTYTQPTEAYVQAVARALRVKPDQRIDVRARLGELVAAISRHENAGQVPAPADLAEGIKRALA